MALHLFIQKLESGSSLDGDTKPSERLCSRMQLRIGCQTNGPLNTYRIDVSAGTFQKWWCKNPPVG